QLRQHLAIEVDAGLLEGGHELRVREPHLAACGVDAHDPERSRLALLLLAAAVGEGPRAQDRLGRSLVELPPPAEVALGLLEDLLAPSARLGSTFCPWHSPSPPLAYRYGTSAFRRRSSALSINLPLRSLRRRCGSLPSSLCCFQPPARLSLPEPVRLSRLRAPRLVFIFGILSLLVVCLRAQDDVQHPALEPWIVLGVGDVLRRLEHLVQHLPAELRVRHLAPLEAHGDLGLVALLQEAPHVLQLEVEVVLLGLRPHLDFLDLDGRLLLARFLEPPGLRVLVLAEVHDTAHRRRRIGRHLDQIELLLARGLQGRRDGQDTELRAVGADDADFADTDAFIDTDVLGLADRRGSSLVSGHGPAHHERPTARLASREPISRARSVSTRSIGTAPRSSPVR